MTLALDSAYAVFSLRRTLLGLDEALLVRVITAPTVRTDNDAIATATAGTTVAQLQRPRERRKKEKGLSGAAAELLRAGSEGPPRQAPDASLVAPVMLHSSFGAFGAFGGGDSDDAMDADPESIDGLMWSSESVRVSGVSAARLAWAAPGPSSPGPTSSSNDQLQSTDSFAAHQPQQQQQPSLQQQQQQQLQIQQQNNQDRDQLYFQQQLHYPQPRVPYTRVTGPPLSQRRSNAMVTEKPNLADLTRDTDPEPSQTTAAANLFLDSTTNSDQTVPSDVVVVGVTGKRKSTTFNNDAMHTSTSTSAAPTVFDYANDNSTVDSSSLFAKIPPVLIPVTVQPGGDSGFPVKRSALALLLNDQGATENPFADEFGFLSGKGEAYPLRIKIYIPSSLTPFDPILIIIKRDATVEELIGYTLYEYFNKLSSTAPETVDQFLPHDKCDVCCWSLRLVEDDGTIDEDFPALDRMSKMQRSNFEALALCLCTPSQIATNQAARRTRTAPTRFRPTALSSGAVSASMGLSVRSHGMTIPATMATTTLGGTTAVNNPFPNGGAPGRNPPLPPLPRGGNNIGNTGYSNAPGAIGSGMPPSTSNPSPANTAVTGTTAFNTQATGFYANEPFANNSMSTMPSKPQVYVKIHLYSTLEVKHTATFAFPANATMAQVFETICTRRKYDMNDYVLKMGDTRTDVALDRVLEDMFPLEFCVLKKDRGGAGDIFLRPPDEVRVKTEEPGLFEFSVDEILGVYRQYTVLQKQLMGRSVERIVTLDGEWIHVMGVGDARTLVDVSRTVTYHISGVLSCALAKKQSRLFRLLVASANRTGSAATTTGLEFEAGSEMQAADLCARVSSMIQLYANPNLSSLGGVVATTIASISAVGSGSGGSNVASSAVVAAGVGAIGVAAGVTGAIDKN
ncbi:hypothetical protein BCR33DRAFT_717943 [Rhizoclosmatium globosum]|uniref:SIN1-domain-containing protein n=1 Tax=Rhizoclosmatium globosum TaxID=329046 RepID=A0A1Y2C6U6_9FUNG|nr:hypothetical protein BCR33DRAFT_717943 [Rhizoclosmatium globosum]|eukprot:ORY42750.1 hypothetical protein BCR33DRAFT_717943 [Rhizoclosmatium globosum]